MAKKGNWTVDVQFLNYGDPIGILHSYKSFIPVKEGDIVVVRVRDSYGIAEVKCVEEGFVNKIATNFIIQKVDTKKSEELLADFEELKKLEIQIKERVEQAKEEAVIKALAKDDPELAALYERYKTFKD